MRYQVLNQTDLKTFLRDKYSVNKIKGLLKHGLIYVNQKPVFNINTILNITDEVLILKGNNKLPFKILYEDKNIIAINKPSGLLTIATSKEQEKTVYHYVSNYLKSKNQGKVYIIHRLDKDTSGVLILAKSLKVKNFYQNHWQDKAIKREYVALVKGTLKEPSKEIVNYLKETTTGNVKIVPKNQGKKAITYYETIKKYPDSTLVKILIKTGKKHQIRLAFNSIGNPIVGDKKYGGYKKGPLHLHASSLTIKTIDSKTITIDSLKPEWL